MSRDAHRSDEVNAGRAAQAARSSELAGVRTVIPAVDLVGEGISMRPCRGEFAALLHEAAIESAETVGRWMPWCHAEYKEAESAAWLQTCVVAWQNGEAYEFAIFDRAGEYVGGAGLNQLNKVHNFANLGYWVRQSRQRQGLAVEAVRVLASFGFENLGLTRIEIVAASENLPSRRVAEKAGAVFESLLRNRLLIRGLPLTAAMYAMIP